MKNFIILFLALLWACFAAEDSEGHLRRRMAEKTKEICVNLHPYGYGHHTFVIPAKKQRWFHKWQGVTLGACKAEDYVEKKSDLNIRSYCRLFGNKTWCTVKAPKLFEKWLLDHDATRGPCTQKNQGDRIVVEYDDDDDGDGDDVDDVFCAYLDDKSEHQSLEIVYPDESDHDISFFEDWFYEETEYVGECDPWDDDGAPNNLSPRFYCVHFGAGEWCTVDTDRYLKEWLQDHGHGFRNGPCEDYNIFNSDCELSVFFYNT